MHKANSSEQCSEVGKISRVVNLNRIRP